MRKSFACAALFLALCLPCFASYTRPITVSGFASGLSTVGYTAYVPGTSTVAIARTTTGVVETPTGSGNYQANFTGADNTNYTIVWDSGGGSPVYASAIPAIAPDSRLANLDVATSTRQSGSAPVTLPATAPTGYGASPSDFMAALKADPQWKAVASYTGGKYAYDPTAKKLHMYDFETGLVNFRTLTLTQTGGVTTLRTVDGQ